MDIFCKDLYYQYDKNTEFVSYALNGVSLTIKEGEFFGIIGHTGSGKSTFIQHLNGLIPVEQGILTVGDYDLSKTDVKKSKKEKKQLKDNLKNLRRSVGMVFQYPEYQLFAETVFDDVSFGIKNFMPNLSPEEVRILTKNAIETVGLDYEKIKDKSPFELSGGQKRRVAIAGVIASRPSILILDEPCAGLDPTGKTALWNLLHSLHERVIKTIIVVSHDMNDVASNCTSVAVFNRGKVIKTGTPKELFSDSAFISDCGLEVPVTAYLTENLKNVGIKIDSDYTINRFAESFANYLKNTEKADL